MYQGLYDEIVRFASTGDLAPELTRAREEYVQRTGQLLETDTDFERRIAAFLEWYVLDRLLAPSGLTPAQLYLDAGGADADDVTRQQLAQLGHTTLSLFEFRRVRGDHLAVDDLLTGERHQVFERRRLAGLESGDILEARLVASDGQLALTETWAVHPRRARDSILKAAKRWRKDHKGSVGDDGQGRIEFVHRVAYLANRSQRYRHVDPVQIFADLRSEPSAA